MREDEDRVSFIIFVQVDEEPRNPRQTTAHASARGRMECRLLCCFLWCASWFFLSPFPLLFMFTRDFFPFSPFHVETHQREDLWNPLHLLVISGNIRANVSFK